MYAVLDNLVVKMGAGTLAGGAYFSYELLCIYDIAFFDRKRIQMGVQCLKTVGMDYDHMVPMPLRRKCRGFDFSGGRGKNVGTDRRGQVYTEMIFGDAVDGMFP